MQPPTSTLKRKATTGKTGTINIRATPKMRGLIDRAATTLGKTRSDFMLEAAHKAAVDTILDQTLFEVNAASYKRFAAALDASPKNNEKLRALMQKTAPWE